MIVFIASLIAEAEAEAEAEAGNPAENGDAFVADIIIAMESGAADRAIVPAALRQAFIAYAEISDNAADILSKCQFFAPGLTELELAAIAALYTWPTRINQLLDYSGQRMPDATTLAQRLWEHLDKLEKLADSDLESLIAYVADMKRFLEPLEGQFGSSRKIHLAHFTHLLRCETALHRSIDTRDRSTLLRGGQRADYISLDLIQSSSEQFSKFQSIPIASQFSNIVDYRLKFLQHGKAVAASLINDIQHNFEPRALVFLSILMLRSAERFMRNVPEISLILAIRALELYCVGILVSDGFSIAKNGRISKKDKGLSGAGAVWIEAKGVVESEERAELDIVRKQKLKIWSTLSPEIDLLHAVRNQSLFGHGIIRTSEAIAGDAIATITRLINARESSRAMTAAEYDSLRKWSAHALKTALCETIRSYSDVLSSALAANAAA